MQRVLALLALLQSGKRFTGEELAARLNVPPRTLRRDISRLRDYGYPVETPTGPGRLLPARGRAGHAPAATRRRRGRCDPLGPGRSRLDRQRERGQYRRGGPSAPTARWTSTCPSGCALAWPRCVPAWRRCRRPPQAPVPRR
ncbi:helix-turn-helix transcriptional regulator [Streptomyces thioluteus]|uniref:helix-turn-helix transcriptional regulator n=1 Tax=Streptomyces thioluteus TaxID=66431 RepID=UPI003CD09F15